MPIIVPEWSTQLFFECFQVIDAGNEINFARNGFFCSYIYAIKQEYTDSLSAGFINK